MPHQEQAEGKSILRKTEWERLHLGKNEDWWGPLKTGEHMTAQK